MMAILDNERGFTLIELLVAMAMSGIVMAAVYVTYLSQQRSYVAQQEVAAMQQKLRTAIYFMTRHLQEAGCNPLNATTNAPGIITANVGDMRFTADLRGSAFGTQPDGDTGDPYEDITYSLVTSNGVQSLCVTTPSMNNNQPEPVIQGVDALDFVYLDENGNVLNDDGNGNVTTSIADIRSVEVTLVVRSEREDMGYVDDRSYLNNQGDVILPPQNDHFRRRSSTVQIRCRNLGL